MANGATGLKINLTVWTNLPYRTSYYATWDLSDPGSGYAQGDKVTIPSQSYDGSTLMPEVELTLNVESNERTYSDDIEHELNIYDAAADFWKYEGDQSSHLEGPEHQITYVNEIIKDTVDQATYENLAYAGLRVNSSK